MEEIFYASLNVFLIPNPTILFPPTSLSPRLLPKGQISPMDINDPLFPQQWNLERIKATKSWPLLYNGNVIFNGIAVPVLSNVQDILLSAFHRDSPNSLHPDLKNISILRPVGSNVFIASVGIAIAHSNNGEGVAGVILGSPDGDNALLVGAPINTAQCISAINSAIANGADIILGQNNLPCASFDDNILSAIATAIYCGRGGSKDCRARFYGNSGTCSVISGTAGLGIIYSQEGRTPSPPIFPPKPNFPIVATLPCFSGKMLVTAPLSIDDTAIFPGGPEISVSAPGERVIYLNELYNNYPESPISYYSYVAASQTGGVAGLILKANSSLTQSEVFDILTSTAKDLGAPGRDDSYGWGLIDAWKAVVKTIFLKEPSLDITNPPSTVFIDEFAGAQTQVSLIILNRGPGTLYAVVQISPESAGSITSTLILPDGRQSRSVVIVSSPLRTSIISILFTKNSDGQETQTFTLTYCTNEGIEPSDIWLFGGPLTFPIASTLEFSGYGKCTELQITVTTGEFCGNGICGGGENCLNCPQDCGSCPPGMPTSAESCLSFCYPICIPIICLPKVGCTFLCLPGPGFILCPICCIVCKLIFGLPLIVHGVFDPAEIDQKYIDILSSIECQTCIDDLQTEGGSALDSAECKICIEKVVGAGTTLSPECDMCLMNIRDFGEVGADSESCAMCLWQAEEYSKSLE